MTKTERNKAQSALNKINKCNGICKTCKHCDIRTAGSFYAFYCKIADNAGYQPLSNTMQELRKTTIDCLQLELS